MSGAYRRLVPCQEAEWQISEHGTLQSLDISVKVRRALRIIC